MSSLSAGVYVQYYVCELCFVYESTSPAQHHCQADYFLGKWKKPNLSYYSVTAHYLIKKYLIALIVIIY